MPPIQPGLTLSGTRPKSPPPWMARPLCCPRV